MTSHEINSNLNFIDDVDFHEIRTWLANNCLITINQNYFLNLEPIFNIAAINESLNFTEEILFSFSRKDNIPISKVPNIFDWFPNIKIKNYQLNSNNFKDLYKVLILSSQIKKTFNKNKFPLWYDKSKKLFNSQEAQSKIEHIFDTNFEFNNNASPILNKLSKNYLTTESKIRKKIKAIFIKAQNEGWINGDQVVFRNGRSVLPIKNSFKRKINGITQGQSATNQTIFIEPMEIIELNNQLTEIEFGIYQEKQQILKKLTSYFKPLKDKILESFNILIKLDQHYTIAQLSYKLNAVYPKIEPKSTIKIINAINPIFSLSNQNAIPLNLDLKDNKILLLSGPNAGGKTVVLKSLGLYAMMAQSGIFIPADFIQLPLFKKFISDIGDGQSIQNNLSTFSSHINKISYILNYKHTNSLILLDELGTGTEPESGSALAQAILKELLQKNCIVFVTTHLRTLKIWAHSNKNIINGGMKFDKTKLNPTFEFQTGLPSPSYTFEIAKIMGINNNLINYAQSLIDSNSIDLENILTTLADDKYKVDIIKKDLENKKNIIDKKETLITKKEKEIDKQFNSAKIEANSIAQEIILNARTKIESLIEDIRKSEAKKSIIKKTQKDINESLKKIKSTSNNYELNINELPKNQAIKGTDVFISKINSYGTIINPPDKNNKVLIESNGIKITVKLVELSKVSNSKKLYKHKNITNFTSKIPKPKSIQLDIRGKRVDEALIETEQFLNSSLISNLEFVYILHGKGTGILMDAVHKFLRTQSYIKEFKFANEDQGGSGITHIQFK